MEPGTEPRPATRRERRRDQPKFFEAVVADARTTFFHLGQRLDSSKPLRSFLRIVWLTWTSDAFLAQVVYRFGARMWGLGVPILPRVARGITMMTAQISISDTVVVRPGVSISHGYVCIGGLTEIRSGTLIAPFVSIGLLADDLRGPTIGRRCTIGTGARLLGPLQVGDRAQVGANAVVIKDVPADAVAVGIPARLIDQPVS
jgi:serine O-acetyltransferase